MPLQKYNLKNQLLTILRKLHVQFVQLPQRMLSTPSYFIDVENQFWQYRALNIVVKKNVAEELDSGVQTIEMLAQLTQSNADQLYRLMRFLASFGVFLEYPGRRFAHTERSRRLSSNHPKSIKPQIILQNSRQMIAPLVVRPETSVEEQRSLFAKHHNTDFFNYLNENRCFNYTFTRSLTTTERSSQRNFSADVDWSKFKRIFDIGGAVGVSSVGILEQNKELIVTVFDRANVIESAKKYWRQRGMENALLDRLHFAEGNPLVSKLPQAKSSNDLYFLAAIVPMLNDSQMINLLRSIVSASAPFVCTTAIVDIILPTKQNDKYLCAADFQTMLTTQGRQRTLLEWKSIAELAGLTVDEVVKTRTQSSVIILRA
ncbi:Multifunctional cyclase-dehydratase-3-O-methyl transferase TcmN [BD1-7 clade bacterium]|uniref:Multifunctional cyclase-dehydratase-3-O-methyl transferase TcmN n=1 Tax=BD1-7 clade bacterium TaxID=2029982 RepID=A0A5S9PHB1_9GAMM|nr:Multifunctional cyclase-dehydratase-3-O-methyl transferase TcmN [BD1-7 clade bacterium]